MDMVRGRDSDAGESGLRVLSDHFSLPNQLVDKPSPRTAWFVRRPVSTGIHPPRSRSTALSRTALSNSLSRKDPEGCNET